MDTDKRPIDPVIKLAFDHAWICLKEALPKIRLESLNESTFRYFFLLGLVAQRMEIDFDTEWYRNDLLVRAGGPEQRLMLIEFKFYRFKRRREVDGKQTAKQRFPGKKNKKEFENSLRRLKKFPNGPHHLKRKKVQGKAIAGKYLIAVIESSLSKEKDFWSYYKTQRFDATTSLPHDGGQVVGCIRVVS